MDKEPQLPNNSKRICGIKNEIQRAKYGTLRNAALHHSYWGCRPIVSHILPPSDEIRSHPVEYHSGESDRCLESVKKDAVIYTIEGGTEVKHTKQGEFTLISSDQYIRGHLQKSSVRRVAASVDFPAGVRLIAGVETSAQFFLTQFLRQANVYPENPEGGLK